MFTNSLVWDDQRLVCQWLFILIGEFHFRLPSLNSIAVWEVSTLKIAVAYGFETAKANDLSSAQKQATLMMTSCENAL